MFNRFAFFPPVRAAFVAVVVGALLLAAPAAAAADPPLTLAEAQRRALARSQALPAQDAMAVSAREMAHAAGQFPDPVLKFGVDNLPVDGANAWNVSAEPMTMRRIGVMQEWPNAQKRDARRARFEREADRALTERSAAAAAVMRDTALAWLDRYYAEASVALYDEQAAETRLEVEAAEAAYRAGRGSQADIFAARSAVAMLAERSSEARRRVASSITMLARWLGSGADAPLAGRPDFADAPLAHDRLDDLLQRHPAIAVLAQQEAVASAEVKLAQANRDPDWSVEVMYQQRGSAFSNMMSIGISVPLPWDRANRQDRDVAARLAQVDQARALWEEALRAHRAEVATMLEEWSNGHERLRLYDSELRPLARERTTAAVAAYRGGRASLAEVLAARRGELDVRRDVLQLERETARLWAQLAFLDATPVAPLPLPPAMKEKP